MVSAQVHGDFLPDNYISVLQQLKRNASRTPTSLALVSLEIDDSITWKELLDWCSLISQFLQELEIKANDKILVLGENSIENLILYYGIQAYGATYCTINTDINKNHIIEMIDRIEPELIFFEQSLETLPIEEIKNTRKFSFGDRKSCTDLFAKLSCFDHNTFYYLKNNQTDNCVLCFTSGTSAQPKAVIHSFCNYQAIAQHQLERWSLKRNDRILEFRSMSWASAHMISLNPTLLAGATLLLGKKFSRSHLVSWIEKYKPSIIVSVPTVVNMLLERPIENGKKTFESVRFISCSTAPLMADAHRRFEKTYDVELVQLYGMSEGGIIAANTPGEREIGSVGTAGKYQDISIRDSNRKLLGTSEIGEIETLSAQHAKAYLYADGNVELLRGKPLKTGDLGYIDGKGFLRITGRAKDVVIRGGVNISPLEIDSLISQLPGVMQVVTFGVPDPVYGEELVSWVVSAPGHRLTIQDLKCFCAEKLPEQKRPKYIQLVQNIPKNKRGKIDREKAKLDWQTSQRKGNA